VWTHGGLGQVQPTYFFTLSGLFITNILINKKTRSKANFFFQKNTFISNFTGEIATPTTSYIDKREREIKKRAAISYFFSFILHHISVRGKEKKSDQTYQSC
jgi:hypothetical protein